MPGVFLDPAAITNITVTQVTAQKRRIVGRSLPSWFNAQAYKRDGFDVPVAGFHKANLVQYIRALRNVAAVDFAPMSALEPTALANAVYTMWQNLATAMRAVNIRPTYCPPFIETYWQGIILGMKAQYEAWCHNSGHPNAGVFTGQYTPHDLSADFSLMSNVGTQYIAHGDDVQHGGQVGINFGARIGVNHNGQPFEVYFFDGQSIDGHAHSWDEGYVSYTHYSDGSFLSAAPEVEGYTMTVYLSAHQWAQLAKDIANELLAYDPISLAVECHAFSLEVALREGIMFGRNLSPQAIQAMQRQVQAFRDAQTAAVQSKIQNYAHMAAAAATAIGGAAGAAFGTIVELIAWIDSTIVGLVGIATEDDTFTDLYGLHHPAVLGYEIVTADGRSVAI